MFCHSLHLLFAFLLATTAAGSSGVSVSLSSELAQGEVHGRVRVYFSTIKPDSDSSSKGPMYENGDEWSTNQVFGFDAVFTSSSSRFELPDEAKGYPVPRFSDLAELPFQSYNVQAELAVFKEVQREGLPPTFLPTSCVSKDGSNGAYEKPDGTLYSKPIVWEPGTKLDLTLSEIIPDSTPQSRGCAGLGDGVDSDWIKTVRIQSSALSKFYKNTTDATLEACVLLPYGYEDHPDAKYPLVLANGHYNPTFNPGGEFIEEKPTCDDPDDYKCVSDWYGYYLYQNWTAPTGTVLEKARVLLVTINHPTSFFDDSYAVDSETMGPYGTAIMTELIPEVERRFRGLGEGWARGLMGGSTGGWESAAHMILYPDMFSYSLAACPDSVTFTRHTSVNMYEQENAYYYNSDFKKTPTPGYRDGYSGQSIDYVYPAGDIITTFREMNLRELALGENGLSCGQCDAWEATWSPIDENTGYAKRAYDKETGVIDKDVVEYWKKMDLARVLVANWEELKDHVNGKLHFAAGGSDSFYLNNGIYDFQRLLEDSVGKDHGVTFTYGAHDGLGMQHCFRGYEYDANGKVQPNSITRLTYVQDVVPRMVASWVENAPDDADLSWRY
mmetsp:Transcript_8992/g.18165  ORF Transcript_8992/g.18165 Transcript_8992/m.18165 type:complete len:612 (-) Transcript_8992:97-1932(-)